LQNTDGEWIYNGICVVDIGEHINGLVSQSLWILKKSDIPCIIFNKLSNYPSVKKYQLEEIDNMCHIYASIVDVNTDSDIRKELEDAKILDASKKVIVSVDFNTEIRCKRTSKVIQLRIYSQFGNKEQANSVEDVDANWLQSV
jgi:hypothetical protein